MTVSLSHTESIFFLGVDDAIVVRDLISGE